MAIEKENRLFLLELLQRRLDENKIDLWELGADTLGSPYRNFRPSCDCRGTLSPEEETWNWHTHHVNKCLNDALEALDFLEKWENLVAEEGKKFNQEKKKAIERIKSKDTTKSCFNYIKHEKSILNCTNSKQLVEKEKQITQEIEQISKQTQTDENERKKQEEENERLRKEEEKKQQKFQKNFEEEEKKMKEKLKEENQSSNTTPKNNESSEKLNNLKNKFHELYQKGKKYDLSKLIWLLNILGEIGKETILDEYFLNAKTELQIIWDKLTPHLSTIDYCRHLIEEEENSEDKEKELDEYRLEECKKALEELGKIVHLYPRDENLLKKINVKLKTFDLEEEIRQLKNQKSDNPQQQTKNQKKIEEKQKELEEIKKQNENRENKEFQVSPQILSKFLKSIPEFTKEKIENLIIPIKDNSDFLQEIKNKHRVENLNTLFTTKSAEEIIKIIKRFEYDNLSLEDKENKDKKVRGYCGLKNSETLTDEKIDDYLFKETTGKFENKNPSNEQYKSKESNNIKAVKSYQIFIPLLSLFFFFILWTLRKYKQGWYKLTAKEQKNNHWRFWQWGNEYIKKILEKNKFSSKLSLLREEKYSLISKVDRKKTKKIDLKLWME